MKIKIVLTLLFCSAISVVISAQSLYQFKYNLAKDNGATNYTAFFILQDNGTGTIRIKYPSKENGENILLEMNAEEQYSDIPNVANDKLFYKLTNPVFISGTANVKYEPAIIVFTKNISTGEYEPMGIINGTAGSDTTVNTFSSVTFLDKKNLEKDLVLEYFTKQDIFYKNLFETQTRALSPFEKNTRLILLAVANINEPEIGASCLKDMNRAVETFTKLANFMEIKFESKTISGNDYNKATVEKQIASLTPAPNDIIVFYYSGHGFRKSKDSRRFPYIDLRAKPDNTYMVNSLNIEDIYDSIRKKGARLNLIIGDCCNTEVTAKNAIGAPIPRTKGFSLEWNLENCRALFLNPMPRSILVTAADIDQKASSNNDFGGFFSYFFKTSMENQLSFFNKNANWENVLNDTKRTTIVKAEHTYCDKPYIPENICEQYPIWK